MIKTICEEHFLLENFWKSFSFLRDHNFHPFFKGFPFSKHNEEIIFADLIKSFDFIKPFFNWNELSWFRVGKFRDTFTRKSIVVNNIVFYYFRVRNNIHVVVIVWIFSDHVNKLLSSEFFLTYHFKKSSDFSVLNWNVIFWALFDRWKGSFWLKILTGYGMLKWCSPSHW